jgi:phosphoribosylamine-glycine ligase
VAAAYAAAGEIRFDGAHYRRDIGHRALTRLRQQAAQLRGRAAESP